MSTTTESQSPADTTPNAPAPATDAAASTGAAPKKFDKQGLAKKLAAKAREASSEEPTLTPDDVTEAASEPAAPPEKSRADRVREALQAKHAKRHEGASQQRERSEAADLRAQLEQVQGQRGVAEWLEKLKKDPVAAIREAKGDPTQVLKLLTRDALSVGSVRAESESASEAKKAREVAERTAAALEARDVRDYWANEDREFSKLVADEKKFPLSAEQKAETRLRLAGRILRDWNENGIEYDRELLADALESELEEMAESARKKEPAKATQSSSTSEASSTPQVAAKPKPKKPTTTITAEAASQSGARGERSQAQRKAELIERFKRRQIAASLG